MATVVTGAGLSALQAAVDAANRHVVLVAGLTYAQLVIAMMRHGDKSGVMGPVRQRSAPGEAPAEQYGDLIRDIWVDVDKVGGVGWVSTAGLKSLQYGVDLEFGKGNLEPRPAWRPAFTPALALAQAKLGRSLTGTVTIAPNGPQTVQAATAAEAA